jgi:hypothetical protein
MTIIVENINIIYKWESFNKNYLYFSIIYLYIIYTNDLLYEFKTNLFFNFYLFDIY